MEITSGKKFERPKAGNYAGTVIDIVTLPNSKSTFNGVTTFQDKVRIVWVLGPAYPGQVTVNKEGKPFEQIGVYNAKLINKPKKSKLYELLEQMLQGAPPVLKNDAELEQLMMGRSNQLFLVANADPTNPEEPFINIAGVTPLPPGIAPPQAPAGFVRFKDRPKTQAGANGQAVQTYAQPPAQPVAGAAPATPGNVVTF